MNLPIFFLRKTAKIGGWVVFVRLGEMYMSLRYFKRKSDKIFRTKSDEIGLIYLKIKKRKKEKKKEKRKLGIKSDNKKFLVT